MYIVATPGEIAFIKPMIAMRNGSQSGATLYASSRSAQGTAGPDFRLEMEGLQYSEIPMLAGGNLPLICENERYQRTLENFGYLIQQATVFGQHVHVGCASGDDAIYLLHGLSRFVPHFIALSAASPYMHVTAYASIHRVLFAVQAAFCLR